MPAVTSTDLDLWLAGLGPYVEAATGGDSGKQERLYTLAIAAAHTRFEQELQMAIDKKVIKMQPDSTLVKGEDYDEEEAPLDYISGQISTSRLPRYRLRRRPVLSVERLLLAFSPEYTVLTVPAQWVRLNKHMGTVDIVPVGASAQVALQMGMWFAPLVAQDWPWRAIPQFVCIDYTAGFENPETDPALDEMRPALLRAAAAEVGRSLRNLLPTTISVDGLTHSLDPLYQRLEQYEKETQDFLRAWQRRNRPPRLVVIG
jgi:hypothetical protein